jgi:DNA polymerase III alpha subunit
MKDRTSLSQNDPPSLDIQKTQNVPFYDKMKEEFPGNNQQLENYVEIIQHCDFQIQKLKKAKELQKMEKHEKVMMKKRDNISQKLVSNFKEKQLLAKLRMEKELAKDQRGKPDFDRSTWWLENEQ